MKQWFSKHWTGGSKGQWTLRDGKQERPIIIAVAPDLAITDVSKVRSRKGEPRQTPEWRSQSWESGENKAARIHPTEDQREGRGTESELQRSAGGPPGVFSGPAQAQEETTRSWRNSHQKRLKGTESGRDTGPGITHAPARLENLHDAQGFRLSAPKSLPSVSGRINLEWAPLIPSTEPSEKQDWKGLHYFQVTASQNEHW